jgi:hypothetical protein
VRIIDFDCAYPDTVLSISTARGTPGYLPNPKGWRDGCTKWDVWALAAMILEADMPLGEYEAMMSEEKSLKKINAHIQRKGTCNNIVHLVGNIFKAKRDAVYMPI